MLLHTKQAQNRGRTPSLASNWTNRIKNLVIFELNLEAFSRTVLPVWWLQSGQQWLPSSCRNNIACTLASPTLHRRGQLSSTSLLWYRAPPPTQLLRGWRATAPAIVLQQTGIKWNIFVGNFHINSLESPSTFSFLNFQSSQYNAFVLSSSGP